jgi:ribose 5-phosphate isomerase RpiB
MKIGIATDHGGFGLKEELVTKLRDSDHESEVIQGQSNEQ